MKRFVYLNLVLGTFFVPLCHAEFKIGQYELGMSNKAAAKIGLTDCIDSRDQRTIRCIPTGLPEVGATLKYAFFDATSRKLTAMRVESVRFHPFPEVSPEASWRQAALSYESAFAGPLKLHTCGSFKPEVERAPKSVISTCFSQKTDAYRELKIGYNRVEESGGGHGMHRKSGNTPHVGASVYMAFNPLIKHEFLKRKRQRQENERARARPTGLKRFERGE